VTRAGFVGLVIPLGFFLALGTLLFVHGAWPDPSPELKTCEEWFASPPSEGAYTVEGCVVDVGSAGWTANYDGSVQTVVAPVRLPTTAPELPPALYVATRDPEVIAFATRLQRDPEGSRELARTRERYRERFAAVRTFTGTLSTHGEAYWIAEEGVHTPDFRFVDAVDEGPSGSAIEAAIGGVVSLFALALLIPIVLLQRRWKAIERTLRARAEGRPDAHARPQTF
jgi:hypothetical protein